MSKFKLIRGEMLKLMNLTFIFSLLILPEVFSLAIIQPLPSNVTLKMGESIPFSFEIQALTSKENQSCTYSVSGFDPLIVNFDKVQTKVEAGKSERVFGRLDVPPKAPIKNYRGEIIISCKPDVQGEGVSVLTMATEVPFLVNVIKEENPVKEEGIYLRLALCFFILLTLLFIVRKRVFKIKRKRYENFKIKRKRYKTVKKRVSCITMV